MRWIVLSLICGMALTMVSPPVAFQAAVVNGVISDLTKDENTPTGSVTVVDAKGNSSKFVVKESTRFEFVRGEQRQPTNFLAEHRGEMVAVFPIAGSNPPTAAKVEIIQPAPPPSHPAHILHPKHVVGHTRGTAVHVDASAVTIRLHEPPTPVLGVVTDVGVDADTGAGHFTINVKGKPEKFVATVATRFHKIKGASIERSSFLAEDRGQTVVVFPQLHHHHVAAKVDIILDGPAIAMHYHRYHHKHHWVTFLLTPTTTIERHRDGKNHPATLGAVQVGEELSILPTGDHSHIAKDIHVLLPHQVHGVITGMTSNAIKIKVGHNGNLKHPAVNQEVVIPVVASTQVETVDPGKVRKPTSLAAVAVGERVVVFPAGPPPHLAETIEIHLPKLKPITSQGQIESIVDTTITLKVPAPKGKKGIADTTQSFQLTGVTTIEMVKGKDKEPATANALVVGAQVTIHGQVGTVAVAQRIEVKAAAAASLPKDKNKKKKDDR